MSCPKPGKSNYCEKIIPNRVLAALRSYILFTPFFFLQEIWGNLLSRKVLVCSSNKPSSCISFIMTSLHFLFYSMKLGMGEEEWASGLAKVAFATLQSCTEMRFEGSRLPVLPAGAPGSAEQDAQLSAKRGCSGHLALCLEVSLTQQPCKLQMLSAVLVSPSVPMAAKPWMQHSTKHFPCLLPRCT